jgi:hypothetical protein
MGVNMGFNGYLMELNDVQAKSVKWADLFSRDEQLNTLMWPGDGSSSAC